MKVKYMKAQKQLLLYSILHFLVDFSCAFLLYSELHDSSDWYLALLLYNFCAFALQMPMGVVADASKGRTQFVAYGCILVAVSYLTKGFPVILSVLAGVGNGFFHVGAGVRILQCSERYVSALGVFVSPGALGIYCGTLLGNYLNVQCYSILLILVLTIIGVMLYFYTKKIDHKEMKSVEIMYDRTYIATTRERQMSGNKILLVGSIVCLCFVVIIRSFVGMKMNFSWIANGRVFELILVIATVLGKAVGGILADLIGIRRSISISLTIAAICFIFSDQVLLGLLAVFFFNMTMPITLWLVARQLRNYKGFSFGLLTFALFLGFIPSYLGICEEIGSPSLYCSMAVLSMVLIIVSVGKKATYG